MYWNYLSQRGADIQKKEICFAVRTAAIGETGVIIEWLCSGMKMEKTVRVKLIKRTMPVDILKYFL